MTQTCRTIKLQIEDSGRYGGGLIRTEEPSKSRVPIDSLLSQVLPGKRIEALGAKEVMKLNEYSDTLRPTDLFFQAVHACFSDHYALTLRPEVLMHLIVGEVATTVNRHPETYRALFTSSGEKQRIDVTHNGLVAGDPDSPWQEAIALFEAPLKGKVPPGIMEHLLPPFSTATPETRAASLVAFMDAAQMFYDFHTHTMCGIPEIRLAGTADDYKRVLTAAAQLAEPFRAHLGRYFDHLLPVLKTIADQGAGAPIDESFWTSIYKFESHSGSSVFNGWITAFVNYVQTAEIKGSQYTTAEAGGIVQKPDELFDWRDMEGKWGIKGLNLGSVPAHVSTAPFTWHYLGTERKMLFAGGVLGVDEHEGTVMPRLSYAVLNDE